MISDSKPLAQFKVAETPPYGYRSFYGSPRFRRRAYAPPLRLRRFADAGSHRGTP